MGKKLSAAFLVMIFALSTALVAIPVQAHFTVGRPTGTLPYRVRDFDPHVPGPTGYVWPGSGVVTLDTGAGAPSSPVTWAQQGYMSPPGYQSPFSTNPPGSPSSWLQLAGNAYAPFGAILTSTDDHDNVGDLIFGINFTTTGVALPTSTPVDFLYHSLTIYIPPEFVPPVDWAAPIGDASNIITTITNNEIGIWVWKADVKDPFGPGWWVVYINPWWPLRRDTSAGTYANYGSNPRGILFSASKNYNEWYYVRINGMTAPRIAGRYNFKMFLSDNYPTFNVVDSTGAFTQPSLPYSSTGPNYASTIPAENWPVLLVKGEIDPGIIEGTVHFGAWNTQLYNLPIQLPGRVRAVGIADDPYTGASTGRMVEARGYFNASAKGHYEVEGVAPGVYDIYASVAGYPEAKVASGVKIIAGKSFHLDFLLQPGAIISGVIYSKHSFGEVAWPSTRPVTVEIYDSNEWPSAKPGYVWDVGGQKWEFEHLKSFSPINLTDSPFTSYVTGNVRYASSTGYTRLSGEPDVTDPNHDVPELVAFPWEHDAVGLPAVSWVGSAVTSPPKDNSGLFNGVGPAQYWWVDKNGYYTNGGGTNSFHFQFGIKGYYGAPMEFDGHVPQVYATWINGLTARTYYLRAWINGYVQTDISGTYLDYPFSVAADEWAGDINTPMDLETSSWINKTVHFHDLPGTLESSPIRGPDRYRYLIAEAYDADNILVAMNFTQVPAFASDWNVTLNGFGMIGPTYRSSDQAVVSAYSGSGAGVPIGMKFFLWKYRSIRDYGIMPGTYTIRVYMRGYVQQEFEMASISLSQSPAMISNHMYRGAGINITIYSIDWEHPRADRPWNFPGDEVRVYVYNTATNANVGYVRAFYSNTWQYVTQALGRTTIPYSPRWPPSSPSTPFSKLKYNGTWEIEMFGPDLEGWLRGGRYYYDASGTASSTFGKAHVFWGLDGPGKWDKQTGIWLEFYVNKFGFLMNPGRYRTGTLATKLGLETGTYELRAYTLGYVQKKQITVYAQKGSQADTKVNLAIGVNITANIRFKKEGIFTHVPYNSSVRIRVFNENDQLAAIWFSSLYDRAGFYKGVIHDSSEAYGGYGVGPTAIGPVTGHAGVENRSWVRDSTIELQVLLAGNYLFQENDQYCTCPSDYRWNKFYGIDGWPNYEGTWRIETDIANLYYSDRSFPAPPGLLLGESYHIINGVEGPYGGIWKFNHLGPWEQKNVITVPNAHLGAEASVVFELDLRGLLSGNIGAFTWSDELRPVSWASVTASGAGGTFVSYSWDGYYDMYLPAGSYELTVAESPGHVSQSAPITVSTGQQVTGFSFYLQRSNIPIPEFGEVMVLVAALGALICVVKRIRK
jgi:hypothetical protein